MSLRIQQTFHFQADLRYHGQAHNVAVEVDLEAIKSNGVSGLRDRFEAEHEKLFTYRLQSAIEIMNLRVIVEEKKKELPIRKLEKATSTNPEASSIASFSTLVFQSQEYPKCPIWQRSDLKSGHVLHGPCILTEMDSNTVIFPGFKADIDHVGNILLSPIPANPLLNLRASKDQLDPATVDIFENALRNARNEMDTLMTRTTMSPAIREQQDEFNVIAEPGGKMIVGQFGSFIGTFLETWKGTIEPGDIFLTNDPYSVAGAISHHPDWLILMPIFVRDKLSRLLQKLPKASILLTRKCSCMDSKLWSHD